MLRKILAGTGIVALALSAVVLAGPAAAFAADSGSPAPKAGETCVNFGPDDAAALAGGSQSVTHGAVTVTLTSLHTPDDGWSVSSSGDPLATISVDTSGSWVDHTGESVFAYGSDTSGAVICTAPQASVSSPAPVVAPESVTPPVETPGSPAPYIVVAWAMPSWLGDHTASYPQTFFAKQELQTADLHALDGQLTTCGTQYQVDLYNNSNVTANLLSIGQIYSLNQPQEDIPDPHQWDVSYRLVYNPACLPNDATATATVSVPSCLAGGTATFALTFAEWASATSAADQTVGDHTRTAIAQADHQFSGGASTIDVHYTIPAAIAANSPDCYRPVPVKPSFSASSECGTTGSIALVDTAYIHYAITSGDGKQGLNTVTATAIAPYVLDPATRASWSIDLGTYTDCYRPSVSSTLGQCQVVNENSTKNVDVIFDNSKSTVDVTFTIPSAGVTDVVPAGKTDAVIIPVTTSGAPGYAVLADGEPLATLDSVSGFLGCLDASVAVRPGTTATCSPDGALVNGFVNVDLSAAVAYRITGGFANVNIVPTAASTPLPPGDYTVSATANPGFVLSGVSSWPETIADPGPCGTTPPCLTGDGDGLQLGSGAADSTDPCQEPTLPAWPTNATSTNPVCSTDTGTITVGDVGGVSFFTQVDYTLNGVPITTPTTSVPAGTYTVAASPHTAGDGLTGDTTFPIVVAPTSTLCVDLTTLALDPGTLANTGTQTSGWMALAVGLGIAGLLLLAINAVSVDRLRNRRRLRARG